MGRPLPAQLNQLGQRDSKEKRNLVVRSHQKPAKETEPPETRVPIPP